ncbi:isochorismatase family protein [Deinococcus roseus]|nr:isochorismatase family protein [Deinococcus roseus]
MKTALLVIDVQDSFKALPRWQKRSNPQFEENLSHLILEFRAQGHEIIWITHQEFDSPDNPFHPEHPAYRLMDFVERKPGEVLFEKSTRNSFTSTGLQQYLTQKGIGHLVITGIQTEQCCETTTRVAGDFGYRVSFVTEATQTFPIKHWARDEHISTDEIIKATEYHLAGRFATIHTVDSLLGQLQTGKEPVLL